MLAEYLERSKTAYHAHDNAVKILLKSGFTELKENEKWDIKPGGKYYVSRDCSALIAFKCGK
ncbi:MAG: M18 family aminopeptidase, partial [Clostridia bacterium]|nr:M18 family aminopeptidase [Clostridia bacterium]